MVRLIFTNMDIIAVNCRHQVIFYTWEVKYICRVFSFLFLDCICKVLFEFVKVIVIGSIKIIFFGYRIFMKL
jgi:hypothetical protein